MNVLPAAIFAYLLGSIPSGVIATRVFTRNDVRAMGSGHTGALNTFRAAGMGPAALTLLADAAKGVIAIAAAQQFAGDATVPFAATLVVIGHIFPIFTRFHGGMGLASAAGVFLVLQPFVLFTLTALWFLFKLLLRESLIATMVIAGLLPIFLFALQANRILLAAAIGGAATLFLRHLQVWFNNTNKLKFLRGVRS